MSDSLQGGAELAHGAAAEFREVFGRIKAEVGRVMVGQDDVVDGVLTALLAGGHVLLEGVPGLGKTMLVSSLGRAVDLSFSRIQFTPDMMPADVRGTSVLVEGEGGGHELQFEEGPIVAHLVLADEINRATPKTQSALLEAMQERQVTVGKRTIVLEEPFCVMATQNPVEQEGTYPLPEAQLDRFLFKLIVGYPREDEYGAILDRTTGDVQVELQNVSSAAEVRKLRHTARQVPVPEHARTFAVRLVMATQPGSDYAPGIVNQFVTLGSSPRGAQALLLGAKVRALLAGRFAVACEDIRAVAPAVLRHRVLLGFQARAEGVTADSVVDEVLKTVQAPQEAAR
ncbi:AAA family ATPase [Engelhardtia mirabilis]|uniref:ATPase family associated with various cellular activities (AAA) n=1 Tax=Engelhardtia mirabilis TaxID=2528011 RepID=A0A518BGL4_9BACT|nr:ATPase family associated with various cellular activities (AAA) [Planctomycetes bacterium Pla133]QDV00456.1 ATPase family associated with various cellular activities (AAA) [Planctomycetes bacterium Pla86]